MTSNADIRKAHGLLDALASEMNVKTENVILLRSLIPALPAQKTLEEICVEVEGLCDLASSSEGFLPIGGMGVRPRLEELHAQLQGLKNTPSPVPSLPEGMRLADHEQYGRVVTSPKPNRDGVYDLLVSRPKFETGADWDYAHECELTFIDYEPAHPEFLETEADYRDAPDGTIVAADKVGTAWIKTSEAWHSTDGDRSVECPILSVGTRRILRWGWGNE